MIADREQRQDDQAGAGQHLPHLDPQPRHELRPARRRGVARDDRCRRRASARRRRRLASRASRLASLRSLRFDGARSVIEKRHRVKPRNSERQRDRQDAVEQQRAAEVDQPAVHLGLGPVARRFAQRAVAERLEPRERLAIFDLLADDAGGDEIAHDQHDRADVGRHHRAQHRRQREQQRAGQEDVGQREDSEIPRVIGELLRADRLRIDPRHRSSRPHMPSGTAR